MSREQLSYAAHRIQESVDWSQLPNLATIFEHRPTVNVYWHELVLLTIRALEVEEPATRKALRTISKRNTK